MEENQIKGIISIYREGINLKLFKFIIFTAFSGNEKNKDFTIDEYYKYCHYQPDFKFISKKQFETVLIYLSKHYNEIICFSISDNKYKTSAYPTNFNLKKEEEILNILSIYDNELKNI